MEIKGERVTLRKTAREDLDNLMQLWNDGRVMKWVGFPDALGNDRGKVERWFTKIESNPDRHHFVVATPGLNFCGETYYAVDHDHQRASLDIKLIPQAQGQGLAADALSTLIQHLFEVEEGVNLVWTQPSHTNQAARRLYQRCGLSPAPRPADITDGESYWTLSRERQSRQPLG